MESTNIKKPNSFIVIRMGLASAQICTNLDSIEKVLERFKEWEREELCLHGQHESILNWKIAGSELCGKDSNPNPCFDHPETHKHWLLVC